MNWIQIVINPIKGIELNPLDEHAFVIYAVVAMDMIWFTRNQKIHNDISVDPIHLLISIQRCYR